MNTNRRAFLKSSVAAGVAAGAATLTSATTAAQAGLRPMTDGIVPITLDERRGRVEKARRLMAENHLDAVCLEGGTSLFYFTGVR
ncbi:MAG TPA: aminopeptidase P family N-terminal domain-containing protein, partial [Vicinamibacterales bacterium]|nr:aminopeptidase P family N-terminal domain-containing protein [Vicinamibacterales bacterium]